MDGIGFMVFNATFNNISLISWWSVLLVEETEVPGEKNRPAVFGPHIGHGGNMSPDLELIFTIY
jgi:hypothetical protein